jgi:predicted dehydrogenase
MFVAGMAAAMPAVLPGRISKAEEGRSKTAETPSSPLRFGFIGVGGRGTYLLRLVQQIPGISITAIGDINEGNLNRAVAAVREKGSPAPAGFSNGPKDYRRLLDRADVDAVVIATPVPLHAPMALDALNAGKHVYSEVMAATTLDECWALVDTVEKTGRLYMLAENYCYFRPNMMVLNMIRQGLFGDLTYAECGYVHDTRDIKFNADGSLQWRGEMARDMIGNLYPTHPLGPVAKCMNINRGNRFLSLVSMTTRQAGLNYYAAKRWGADHPAARQKYAVGDSTSTLIQTADGCVIDIRYDGCSARPHPSPAYYGLQGTKGAYISDGDRIWLEGRSKRYDWEPAANYLGEFDHPLWREHQDEAAQTEHGGGDYFVIREFIRALRTGGPVPVDVYDAATWSSITPLSADSIRGQSKMVEVPDFTRGRWKTRKPQA